MFPSAEIGEAYANALALAAISFWAGIGLGVMALALALLRVRRWITYACAFLASSVGVVYLGALDFLDHPISVTLTDRWFWFGTVPIAAATIAVILARKRPPRMKPSSERSYSR